MRNSVKKIDGISSSETGHSTPPTGGAEVPPGGAAGTQIFLTLGANSSIDQEPGDAPVRNILLISKKFSTALKPIVPQLLVEKERSAVWAPRGCLLGKYACPKSHRGARKMGSLCNRLAVSLILIGTA